MAKSKGKSATKNRKRTATKPRAASAKPRPRQTRLPGTEDGFIREIEDAAAEYVEGRDERMEATEREVSLKGTLIAAMHKHQKTHYRRGELEITLIVEKEKVQVRKVRQKEDSDVTVTTQADTRAGNEPFNEPDRADEVANL